MKPSIVFLSSLLFTTTTTTTRRTCVDATRSRAASAARASLVRPTTMAGGGPRSGPASFQSLARGGGQYSSSQDRSDGYYPEDEVAPYSSSGSSNRRPTHDDYYYGGEGAGMNQDDRDYYNDPDRGMVRTPVECCFSDGCGERRPQNEVSHSALLNPFGLVVCPTMGFRYNNTTTIQYNTYYNNKTGSKRFGRQQCLDGSSPNDSNRESQNWSPHVGNRCRPDSVGSEFVL